MVKHVTQSQNGGSTPTSPLQLRVAEISSTEARKVVQQYHYSRKMPKLHGFCFGCFEGEKLYAVAAYGDNPVNRNTVPWLARISGLTVTRENFLELSRLARIEPKNDAIQLSSFLSICHRMLFRKGYRYILSYSDPEHNPAGGVYAASNFVLLGLSKFTSHQFVSKSGKKISWRWLTQWAGRQSPPVPITGACKILELTRSTQRSPPKKQWFLALDRREQPAIRRLDTRITRKNRRAPAYRTVEEDWLDKLRNE